MQAPTHILAGVIIQKAFRWNKYKSLGFVFMFITALLFHGIFDKLAKSTFHPPNPDFASVFWVSYHLFVLLTTILFLFIWGKAYKWGIIFSLLPDSDWIWIHSQTIFNIEIPFYRAPHFHQTINYFLDHTFPFYYLNLLPDNRFNPYACLWEFLLTGVLLLIIYFLLHRKKKALLKKTKPR